MRKGTQLRGEEEDGEVIVGHQTLGGAGQLATNGMEEPGAHKRRQEAGEEGEELMDAEFGCRGILGGGVSFGGYRGGSRVFWSSRGRGGGGRVVGGAGFFEDGGVGVGRIGMLWAM